MLPRVFDTLAKIGVVAEFLSADVVDNDNDVSKLDIMFPENALAISYVVYNYIILYMIIFYLNKFIN